MMTDQRVHLQEESQERDEKDGEQALDAGVVLAVEGPAPAPRAAPVAAAPEQPADDIHNNHDHH